MILKGGIALRSSLSTRLLTVDAAGVVGKPGGFSSNASDGVAGLTVTPSSNADLVKHLNQAGPLNIVVKKTLDFRGTEGTDIERGFARYGTVYASQLAINHQNWCKTNQPSAPTATVTYDKAAQTPLMVSSDKTVLGVDKTGVIRDLNPQYVWGGDVITLDGLKEIWIDHVKTALVGRQHIVAGNGKNTGVTISNHFFEGRTSWSLTCKDYHYWATFLTGAGDTITFRNDYIFHTEGRSPKLGGNAVVHSVNNLWSDNFGHAFEGEASYALLEGSVSNNVKATIEKYNGYISASTAEVASCQAALGRSCVGNLYEVSPAIQSTNNQLISKFGS